MKAHKAIVIHLLPAIVYSIALIVAFITIGYRYAEAKKGEQLSNMVVAYYKAEAAKSRMEGYAIITSTYKCVTTPPKRKKTILPEIEVK